MWGLSTGVASGAGQVLRSIAIIGFGTPALERAARYSAIKKITTKVLLSRHARRCDGGNEVWGGLDVANDGERR
jgi:hypothetical protein